MELTLYLRILQRGWWIIALTALTALAIALVNAYVATPQYRASTRFVVSPAASMRNLNSDQLLYGIDTLDRRSVIMTYGEILNSRRIFEEAGSALQIDPAMLQTYQSGAVALPEVNILELSVTGPNPQTAVLIANAMGQQMIAYNEQLYAQTYDFHVLDTAIPPSGPTSPQPVRDASLALALGTLFGAVVVLLRGQLHLQFPGRRIQIDGSSSAWTQSYFQRHLSDELLQRRTPLVSLGLIHLDGLQEASEEQSQIVVYRLLHQIVQMLRAELRGKDQVGRWGVTSFAVLLPMTSDQDAFAILKRIQQVFSEAIDLELNAGTVHLQPYIGIATHKVGEPTNLLVEHAEAALLRARECNTPMILFEAEKTAPRAVQEETVPASDEEPDEPAGRFDADKPILAEEADKGDGAQDNACTSVDVFDEDESTSVADGEEAVLIGAREGEPDNRAAQMALNEQGRT